MRYDPLIFFLPLVVFPTPPTSNVTPSSLSCYASIVLNLGVYPFLIYLHVPLQHFKHE